MTKREFRRAYSQIRQKNYNTVNCTRESIIIAQQCLRERQLYLYGQMFSYTTLDIMDEYRGNPTALKRFKANLREDLQAYRRPPLPLP